MIFASNDIQIFLITKSLMLQQIRHNFYQNNE